MWRTPAALPAITPCRGIAGPGGPLTAEDREFERAEGRAGGQADLRAQPGGIRPEGVNGVDWPAPQAPGLHEGAIVAVHDLVGCAENSTQPLDVQVERVSGDRRRFSHQFA